VLLSRCVSPMVCGRRYRALAFRTAPYRQVQPARALLLAVDGVANARIAEQVGSRWPRSGPGGTGSPTRASPSWVDGALRAVEPKTQRSRRIVPRIAACAEALRSHKRRQAMERLLAGETWVETGYGFTTEVGTPIESDNLRRLRYPLRQAAGLGEMRLHDLRHSCVTLLLRLGVPPHIVQAVVRHADIHVTMTIYAHASLEDQRKALDQLAELVAG
jgi:hypothetical protein